MKKLLELIQVIDNLSRIPRTGGVLFAGIDPKSTDSLAEHSYKVSYLCMLIGKISSKNGFRVDLEKLLESAITHDWSDGVLLDIPSGGPSYNSYFKDVDFREIFKKGENEVQKAIEDYLKEIVNLNLANPKLSENEKKILAISDLIALLIEILEWKYQGMKYDWFNYVWSNTYNRLLKELNKEFEFLKPLAEELQKAFDKGIKPPNPFLTKPQFQSYKKK